MASHLGRRKFLAALGGAGVAWPLGARAAARQGLAHRHQGEAWLNWQPVLPFHQTLRWIIEWYRAFQAGADLGLLTRTQIERYEALLQD
jgi:CDP-glucose 4,6-dehydratase